ncbi:nucleotidyltransferase domain-containing protein [Thermodesulfovibrio sp. 3907-1M]|uniref:Nucleotidyltransferase domain-containing protein n=1 Tax=Thermodesulfovibrio autotrophicus TaxID=3118333 RepID=A0AAU8GX45_9BACT
MDLSQKKFDEEKFKSLGVVAILIFGSLVEGTFHKGSDIDFAVLFRDKTLPMKNPVKVYGEIYSEISKNFKGKIDIVYLHEAPLSLQFNAVTEGLLLFCSDTEFYDEYKDKVIMQYLDFKYFENIFNEAVLADD